MVSRLSDKCYLEGCNNPHLGKAVFVDMNGHRHQLCSKEHLTLYIAKNRTHLRLVPELPELSSLVPRHKMFKPESG